MKKQHYNLSENLAVGQKVFYVPFFTLIVAPVLSTYLLPTFV